MLIQDRDAPGLKLLVIVHFRNIFSVLSFIDKCISAAEYKMVGHSTYQRKFVQRGTIRDGALDGETFKILLMTILTNKLGCNKLLHTLKFAFGCFKPVWRAPVVSSGIVRRNMWAGIILTCRCARDV